MWFVPNTVPRRHCLSISNMKISISNSLPLQSTPVLSFLYGINFLHEMKAEKHENYKVATSYSDKTIEKGHQHEDISSSSSGKFAVDKQQSINLVLSVRQVPYQSSTLLLQEPKYIPQYDAPSTLILSQTPVLEKTSTEEFSHSSMHCCLRKLQWHIQWQNILDLRESSWWELHSLELCWQGPRRVSIRQ